MINGINFVMWQVCTVTEILEIKLIKEIKIFKKKKRIVQRPTVEFDLIFWCVFRLCNDYVHKELNKI